MAGLSLTLATAKSTLMNTQVQMQVTSNNIANAENTSYARQKAVLTTNLSIQTHAGWLGTGASVDSIIQMRDGYIEQSLLNSMSGESQYNTLTTQLTIAQASFSDDGSTGISQALGDFWDAWDTLVQNPEGITEQAVVYSATESLVQDIRATYDDLDALANTQLPEQMEGTTDEANSLLEQIAELNLQIMRNESSGYSANNLRDTRYQALKDLAEIVPIKFSQETNGSVTVSFSENGTSVTLVSGAQTNATPLQYNDGTGEVTFTAYDGGTTLTTDTVSGGELGGLMTAQDDIQDYMERLNEFTSTLIEQVNGIYNPTSDPAEPFVFTGSDAGDIAMSADFLDGLNSSELSDRALLISNLQDQEVSFTSSTTRFSDYLADIQSQIGSDTEDAETKVDYYEALRSELESQQQSVSGVSLDEEMVDLLKHQQVYQAAAKIIKTTVEMLNTILDIS